jgi:hypothetical protein
MKVRTAEQLLDLIDADLGWRKHELTVFRRLVETASDTAQPALLRASVALLYAHWEGFIKNCCHWYLCYLASRRLTMQQLRPELAALALRPDLNLMAESKKALLRADIVRALRERQTERAKIPTDRDSVRTQSNLSFPVLQEVLISVGCDVERYEDYRDLIDEQLVAPRNRISHGEQDYVRLPEWDDLRDAVVYLMNDVATQIMNAAIEETFYAWKA